MLTHADFFSGLGSWAIAAANNGLKTIALCEREEWLAKGLEKIWKVPCYRDINSFPSQDYANRVWLLTGSPPCQPASRAGKQGGAGDVRWLWPQTIRHTEIIKPTWFCYENPPGIADVGLDGIIVELERIGYEVQPICVPACAVDSPQDRDRFWILGHCCGAGLEERTMLSRLRQQEDESPEGKAIELAAKNGAVADSSESRCKTADKPIISTKDQGKIRSGVLESKRNFEPSAESVVVADSKINSQRPGLCAGEQGEIGCGRFSNSPWQDYQWIACPDRDGAVKIRRAPTGLHELAYGVKSRIPRKFHSKLIAALGNAIVWQIADQIIKAIVADQLTRNP